MFAFQGHLILSVFPAFLSERNVLTRRVRLKPFTRPVTSCDAIPPGGALSRETAGPVKGRGPHGALRPFTRPVTSCEAIPPGGALSREAAGLLRESADKMFHRHLLPGAAFLIPQACLGIKAQPLSREAEAFYANCGRNRLPSGCPTPTRRDWSAPPTPAIKGTRCTSSVRNVELKQACSLNHYC